jgi:hypothetical protein
MKGIREALRKPEADEKREIGIAERMECSGNKILFVVKIGGQSVKLKAKSPQDVKIAILTAVGNGMQIGCGVKFPPIPAVITYRQNGKDGEIVAVEFVPESFKLEN